MTLSVGGYDERLAEFLGRFASAIRAVDVAGYAQRRKADAQGSPTNFARVAGVQSRWRIFFLATTTNGRACRGRSFLLLARTRKAEI